MSRSGGGNENATRSNCHIFIDCRSSRERPGRRVFVVNRVPQAGDVARGDLAAYLYAEGRDAEAVRLFHMQSSGGDGRPADPFERSSTLEQLKRESL